jgi:siroheme synthase-like protein
MAFGYPVLLELAGRRAVVVGEFAVEAGKVEGLLVAGAEVSVVAKGPAAALDRLEADPRVTVHRRGYAGPADLAGAVLCVASAAEPGVRDAIAADARAAGVLVNVMDDVPNCDFAAPAIVRRGDLVIAVGTGGRAPALASRLRAELAERFGPEWTELVDLVGQVRTATLPHLPDFDDRSRRWKAALDLDELEHLVATGQPALAATRLRNRLLAGPPQANPPQTDQPQGCGQAEAPQTPVGYAPPPGDPTPAGRVAARPEGPPGDPTPWGRVAARPEESPGDPIPAGRDRAPAGPDAVGGPGVGGAVGAGALELGLRAGGTS